MIKMTTAVFSACVLMTAGGAFGQAKDASDATRSQGSPGDIKSQAAPGTVEPSDRSPGGAAAPTGSDRPQGQAKDASDATRSQGSPGDIKSQAAPGTGSKEATPGAPK